MAKLRKTLGSPTEPTVISLMESMEGNVVVKHFCNTCG